MTKRAAIAWAAGLVLFSLACSTDEVIVERRSEHAASAPIDRHIATATPPPSPSAITESSSIHPVMPRPSPLERKEVVRLALEDPETSLSLEGHRFLVLTVNPFHDKEGPCSSRTTSCVEVGIYDYTAATGRKVVVDLVDRTVVARWAAADFQGGFSEEEQAGLAAIVAADKRIGPDARLDPGSVKQLSDTDLGGRCGTVSPLHRCLLVRVKQRDGRGSDRE